MRIAKWHHRIVIALLLAPALPAWTSPTASAAANSEQVAPRNAAPILIGVSSVQTGPASEMGRNLILGSRAYFDEVNRAGGINGRTLAILLKDDHYEPDPAVQNTNDFIQRDHVFFLFDYVGTPTLTRTLPLLKYYSALQVVSVGPLTGADPQRLPPYDRFVFNIRASYREETHTLVNYFYSKGYRRIGVLAQADAAFRQVGLQRPAGLAGHRGGSFRSGLHGRPDAGARRSEGGCRAARQRSGNRRASYGDSSNCACDDG